MARGGVIFARDKQDLRQSFQVAKEFFERAKPGAIKFVLIGLSPTQAVDENVLEDYFKLCLDNKARPVVVALPVKAEVRKTYNTAAVKTFRDTINKVVKKYTAIFIDLLDIALNDKLFQDETHLNAEGKAAVTALLGERLYFRNIISPQEIFNADKEFFNVLSKYFAHERLFWSDDRPLPHHIFAKMACEDFQSLSKTLSRETCLDLMARVFYELTYSYLACLAEMLSKDDYIELTTRIFNMTAENIRRKDKIKVGFYFSKSSHWCGDELYNLFAQDERFEPTIFVPASKGDESYRNEFLRDSKKYKAHGLDMSEMKSDIATQNILFRMHPYPESLMSAFRLANLKVKETLVISLPYSFILSPHLNSLPSYNVSWKMFFPTAMELERYKSVNKFGMPFGIYSGYPKLDVFFKPDSKFNFDWKMVCPDAKKIIWAPHWSMNVSWGGSANFQWNYKLMYEFAKAHPEISWVVKPHPLLINRAIAIKIFPSAESCEDYFKKWDELPNARVYTGAYYQDIFATSDGMILDSISFTGEYQYADKPMIYLTRGKPKSFNYMMAEIFKGAYLVEGKDLEGIAAMIQRVFIEGDDYKAADRKAVFDKHLNYLKDNGMLASEFIYRSIADELELNA